MNPLLLLAVLWWASGAFGQAAAPLPDLPTAQATTLGRYHVSYIPSLNPIRINQMHQWEVRITDADGVAVAGASIDISGGMPAHDHGLPTAPRATAYLGEGRYLIEGMKFHMGGAWELLLSIRAGPGEDSVTLSLDL